MKSKAEISIQSIGPQRAAELLQDMWPSQRHLRPYYAERLSREMLSGAFRLSGDAIVLIKGKLANGQHRLNAVVQSKVVCKFLVLESQDDELFTVIDDVMKRTVGDAAGITNRINLGASARWIMAHDKRLLSASYNAPQRLLRSEIVRFLIENHEALQNIQHTIQQWYRKQPILSLSMAIAFVWIGTQKHNDKALQFIQNLYEGNSPDAALDYRERLIKNKLSKSKLPHGHVFALGLKAMKSYMNGTRPSILKMGSDEVFPYFNI